MGTGGSREMDGLLSQDEAAFERPAWAEASTLIFQIEGLTLSALPHKDSDTRESVPLALLRPLLTFTDFCLLLEPEAI